MTASTSRMFALAIAALALAGCANTGGMSGLFGDTAVKPKTVLVTDFAATPDVDAIDRGYSLRMDRNGSNFPILERKRRTLARINDEIVATIVVTLREAGLDARPGSEEALTLNDQAAVVSGRLHGSEQGSGAKAKPIGFGAGHDGVVADITISLFSSGARKPLTGFSVDAKDAGKPLARKKEVAERNAAIAAVLVTEKAEVKLSPDVEAQARRLGRAAGDKVVAYAKAQGWIAAPEVAETPEEPVKLPESKPAQEPTKKKPNKPAT